MIERTKKRKIMSFILNMLFAIKIHKKNKYNASQLLFSSFHSWQRYPSSPFTKSRYMYYVCAPSDIHLTRIIIKICEKIVEVYHFGIFPFQFFLIHDVPPLFRRMLSKPYYYCYCYCYYYCV